MNRKIEKITVVQLLLMSLAFSGCAGIATKATFHFVPVPVLLGCVTQIGGPVQCPSKIQGEKSFYASALHQDSTTTHYNYTNYESMGLPISTFTLKALEATKGEKKTDILIQSVESDTLFLNLLFSQGSSAKITLEGVVR